MATFRTPLFGFRHKGATGSMHKKGAKYESIKRLRTMILLFVGIGFSMVALRLFYMQVLHHDFYTEQAMILQTRDRVTTPRRGTIYDRNMKELAVSAGTESVILSPKTVVQSSMVRSGKRTAEEQQQTLAKILAEELGLAYDSVLKKVQKENSYEVVQKGVSSDVIFKLKERLKQERCTAGVTTQPDSKRYYPYGNFASQVIGFTDADGKGIWGVEAQYDDVLRGTVGRVVQASNAKGGDLPTTAEQQTSEEHGGSVVLTIDEGIQHFLEKNLEIAMQDNPQARGGVSGIVMDVQTGEILAMANKPDFDLNHPRQIDAPDLLKELKATIAQQMQEQGLTGEVSERFLKEGGTQNLSAEEQKNEALMKLLSKARADELNKMWKNKIITDTYEPGSVFKLMTVAAALETQAIHQNTHFQCNGSMQVAGWEKPIKCWKTAGHGSQTLAETLMNSCNVAMMQMTFRNGAKQFDTFFRAFGLSDRTGIDLPGEASNQLLVFSEKALTETPSNLAVSSFGQRFQVTPMQMLMMVDALIDDGKLKVPHIAKEILDSNGTVKQTITPQVVRQVVSKETSAWMRKAMQEVVSSGTGANAYVAGYRVGGKTATSEILKRKDDLEDRYTASFIGAAPMDDPRIIVLVAVSDLPESAPHGGGAVAAPVVARVMADALPYLGVEAIYNEAEKDRKEVTTPSLIGKTKEEAEKLLTAAGLASRFVGTERIITDQIPSAGTKVPITATAVVYLGGQKPNTPKAIPNVIGLSPKEAQERLKQAGFYMKRAGIATKQTGYMTRAARQSPVAGTQAVAGTVVTVTFTNSINVGD